MHPLRKLHGFEEKSISMEVLSDVPEHVQIRFSTNILKF